MLTYATYAIILLSSAWVGFDSHRLRISSSKKDYTWNNGALAWTFCCLLLWIVAFPFYLFKRAKTLRERGESSKSVSFAGGVAVLVIVLACAAPLMGWERLSADELREQVRASIAETWKNHPDSAGVRLKSLSLAHQSGDKYAGVVVADIAGNEEQHAVNVIYDGASFTWSIK